MLRIHVECDRPEKVSEQAWAEHDVLLDTYEAYGSLYNAWYYHWDRSCDEGDLILFKQWYDRYTTNAVLELEEDGEY